RAGVHPPAPARARLERLADRRGAGHRAHAPASQAQVAGHSARRALGILAIAALALALIGCKSPERDAPETKTAVTAEPAAAPLPTNEAEFLAELMPLPDGAEAIEISYAVTGPALEGELTILVREGGYKREHWELRTTGGDVGLRSAGLSIVNPEQIWS